MNKKLYWLSAVLIAFTLAATSCEEEEEDVYNTKAPLVDENGNAAKIDVSVIDYEDYEYDVVDENGLNVYDDNGEIIKDKFQLPKSLTGETVYMFDSEDFNNKSTALKKVVTGSNGSAVFELSEDYFKEDDNPVFYFAVFDNDKVIAKGGLNVKKGKETAISITTKGESSGALYSFNLVKRYQLQTLMESYKMNVKARANLVNDNKSTVRVELPDNTVSWYFSFNCEEKNGNNAFLGLCSALLKYFDPTKGLAKDAIDQIFQPKGSVDCNVYLEDEFGYSTPLITHISEGKYEVKKSISGTYTLVFENPYFARGISVNLDVVAMTVEQ